MLTAIQLFIEVPKIVEPITFCSVEYEIFTLKRREREKVNMNKPEIKCPESFSKLFWPIVPF